MASGGELPLQERTVSLDRGDGKTLYFPQAAVIDTVPYEELACRLDLYISPESRPNNVWGSEQNYLKATVSFEGFKRGAGKMYSETVSAIDKALPIDTFLLNHNTGVNRENILIGKVALYGGTILLASLFMPGWILLGVMIIGLGSAALKYGEGFYRFQRAFTRAEREAAVAQGEEAFAELTIGGALMTIGQGTPYLAHAQVLRMPAELASGLQRAARAACLADDPYFITLGLKQGSSIFLTAADVLSSSENGKDILLTGVAQATSVRTR